MSKRVFLLWALCVCAFLHGQGQEAAASLQVFSKYNYYTSEDSATLVVASSELPSGSTTVRIATGDRVLIDGAAVEQLHQRIKLPLADFPLGDSQLVVEVATEGQAPLVDTVAISRLEPKSNEVKIDVETGGLIVNELPFFPYGFYSGTVADLPDQEVVHGFNLIGPYQGNLPEGFAERKAYMDRCAELGMKVQYGVNSLIGSGHNGARGLDRTEEEKFELLKSEVLAFRDHPALLSWYINDEPDGQGRPSELMEKTYRFIRELDPYHPVSIVFMMPAKVGQFRNSMDIAMTDPYPIPRSVTGVSDYVDQIGATFHFEKSLWLVPQAFGGSEMWPREPSAKELRVMTYLGLLHGARGIQYFMRTVEKTTPQSVSMWNVCRDMAQEVAEMTPFLLSDSLVATVKTNDPEVEARCFSYKNEKLVVAVNHSNTPKLINFELNTSDYQSADLWFENRSVELNDGQLTDFVDAMSTRVYRLDASGKASEVKREGNLIYNPGFEQVVSPGLATGQSLRESSHGETDPAATVFVDSRTQKEGLFSLRLVTPQDSTGKKVRFLPIILQKGNTYQVSVWAKQQKAAKASWFELSIPACRQLHQYQLSSDWKQYSFLFTSDTTSTNAILSLELVGQGTAWFDEVRVSQEPGLSYAIQDDNTALVSLKTNIEEADLYYELSGSKRSRKYKGAFEVGSPTVVKALVKQHKETVAKGQIFVPINKALNKTVLGETKAHEQYPANGFASLTDGKLGTTSFKDPAWMGYLDSTVTFVVDLGSVQDIRSVDLSCLSDANSGIFLPRRVQLFAATKADKFELEKDYSVTEVSKRGEPYLYPVQLNGLSTKARYLKLVIEPFGAIPEGYLFKGTNSWMFVDEILVE